MAKTLSREDYRRIKSYSKEEMSRWLDYHEAMLYNILRKDFEKNYQDEIENSVSNFLIAIWYTLHFNEETHLTHDELHSFMEDLYITVDLFRKGEYKPEDYKEEMEKDGISFSPFDYDKLYREKEGKYQKANKDTIKFLEDMVANSNETSFNLGDIQQLLINRLEVD